MIINLNRNFDTHGYSVRFEVGLLSIGGNRRYDIVWIKWYGDVQLYLTEIRRR